MSYTILDPTDFVVSSDSVVAPAWSTGNPTLTGTNMITSSNAASPAPKFYLDVYDTALTGSTAQVQFSIAYGNVKGSGSTEYNTLVPGMSPSRTTYGQYRNLVYADETSYIYFGDTGYRLHIGNEEWLSSNLAQLEGILYNLWYLNEVAA